MTPATLAVYEALMSGEAAAFVQSSIDAVSPQEQRDLLCALCCAQNEVAVQSEDCAARLLTYSRTTDADGFRIATCISVAGAGVHCCAIPRSWFLKRIERHAETMVVP